MECVLHPSQERTICQQRSNQKSMLKLHGLIVVRNIHQFTYMRCNLGHSNLVGDKERMARDHILFQGTLQSQLTGVSANNPLIYYYYAQKYLKFRHACAYTYVCYIYIYIYVYYALYIHTHSRSHRTHICMNNKNKNKLPSIIINTYTYFVFISN